MVNASDLGSEVWEFKSPFGYMLCLLGEMVDALDLKSNSEKSIGSSPVVGKKVKNRIKEAHLAERFTH